MYENNTNTGENISNIIKDVLIITGLPISNLRAQTYDGAANMSGKCKGVYIYTLYIYISMHIYIYIYYYNISYLGCQIEI